MRTSTTLVLTVATAALLGGIFFYETNRPNSRETALRKEFVMLFDRADIDGITIKGGKDDIELRREGAQWRMVKPVEDRANMAAIAEVIKLAEELRRDSVFEEGELNKKQLKTFGLRKASLRLKLSGKNAPPEILFGKDTAVDGKIYLRLDDSREVSIVSNELRDAVAKEADAFRDPLLADVEGQQVDDVSLKLPTGEIAIHKELNEWDITRPLRARASEERVVDLIGSILHTEIVGFAPEKVANPGQYGLEVPRATVTLNAISRKEPITLELGKKDEKTGQVYARLAARNAVVLLPERVERILALQPNDFRERTLVRVEEDVIDRIALRGPDPDAAPLIFDREGDNWTLREGPRGEQLSANAAAVQEMMTALRTREVAEFVADVSADLPRYGLETPQRRVTFSSYASGNTAESLAGEEAIVTIAFGKVEGDRVYARAENEPYVVSMDASILDHLSPSPAPWLTLSVLALSPEEITALTVGDLKIQRDGTGWKMLSGSGILDTVNVDSLLNTLAKLHAVERLADLPKSAETHDAPAPERSLRFTTEGDKERVLHLYPSLPEGGCYGALEGESGYFLLSAPDEQALKLPLSSLPQAPQEAPSGD